MQSEGKLSAAGDVTYRVNPPVIDPEANGIKFLGVQTTIRVAEDGTLTVNLVGRASYHDRTATKSLAIEPTKKLVDAISDMIKAYGNQIHDISVEAASEALGVARNKGEL